MKFRLANISLFILAEYARGINECPFGPADMPYGNVEETFNKRVILKRKGNNCPCSYAKAECSLSDGRSQDCTGITVDVKDTLVMENPRTFDYPKIKVQYDLQICNYNDFSMNFSALNQKGEERSSLEFWSYDPLQNEKSVLAGEKYSQPTTLPTNTCKAIRSDFDIDTRYPSYYMKAIMNGPQEKGWQMGYCNAFAYYPIEIKYDYGEGECDVSTEATCHVKGQGNLNCEEYIKSMDSRQCNKFTGVFKWKACNHNQRQLYIQTNKSNSKMSLNEFESSGKYKKLKRSLPETIGAESCYEPEPIEKEINPCNPNFSQIHLLGLQHNNETGLFFRDRACESFSFLNLPQFEACTDDAEFKFDIDIGNEQDCTWLTRNAINSQERIDKYCPRAEIKTKCRDTCDFCTCEDDPTFEFELDIGGGEMRSCTWFTMNKDPNRVATRRTKYCYDEDGSPSDIADKCPMGCGFCPSL